MAAAISRCSSAGRHVDCFSDRVCIAWSMAFSPIVFGQLSGEDGVESEAGHPGRVDAEFDDLVPPTPMQHIGRHFMRFRWPGIDGGFAFELPPFPHRWLTVHGPGEPVELLIETTHDVRGTRRELLQHHIGQVFDVGDPVDHRPPLDTETASEFGAQGEVVGGRGGALVEFEGAGIQRQPPPIRRVDTVRHHDMGMQLRVQRTRGVLTERRRDDPFGVDGDDLTVHPEPGVRVTLHPIHHRRDRSVMGGQHMITDTVIADREQGRHRLGSRRGDVEPSDRGVAEPATQQHLGLVRISTSEQGQEGVVVDLAVQAKEFGAAAVPDPTRFTAVEVVVR